MLEGSHFNLRLEVTLNRWSLTLTQVIRAEACLPRALLAGEQDQLNLFSVPLFLILGSQHPKVSLLL